MGSQPKYFLPHPNFSKEDTLPFSVGAVLLWENNRLSLCSFFPPLLCGHQHSQIVKEWKMRRDRQFWQRIFIFRWMLPYLREIVSTGRFGLYILIIMISEVNVLVGSIYWNGRNKIQLPEYDLKRTSSGTHPWTVGDVWRGRWRNELLSKERLRSLRTLLLLFDTRNVLYVMKSNDRSFLATRRCWMYQV